jgi:hypothetical protein
MFLHCHRSRAGVDASSPSQHAGHNTGFARKSMLETKKAADAAFEDGGHTYCYNF